MLAVNNKFIALIWGFMPSLTASYNIWSHTWEVCFSLKESGEVVDPWEWGTRGARGSEERVG